MDKDKRTALITLIIIGVFLVLIYFTNDKTTQHKQIKQQALIIPDSLINEMYAVGLLYKLELQNNTAYIFNSAWSRLTIDDKKNLAITLAMYCGQKTDGKNRVYLYDHMTGKQLAKYSESLGFSVKD